MELTELLAMVSGAFMLRGHNWARWLALAWIIFHVILSIFRLGPWIGGTQLCSVWRLPGFSSGPEASRYFRGRGQLIDV